MEIITLKDCLKQMQNGFPFTVTVVKADRKRGSGGEMRTYVNCILKHSPKDSVANHFQHQTRNLLLANKELRKIHIRLIVQFNGARVIYWFYEGRHIQ